MDNDIDTGNTGFVEVLSENEFIDPGFEDDTVTVTRDPGTAIRRLKCFEQVSDMIRHGSFLREVATFIQVESGEWTGLSMSAVISELRYFKQMMQSDTGSLLGETDHYIGNRYATVTDAADEDSRMSNENINNPEIRTAENINNSGIRSDEDVNNPRGRTDEDVNNPGRRSDEDIRNLRGRSDEDIRSLRGRTGEDVRNLRGRSGRGANDVGGINDNVFSELDGLCRMFRVMEERITMEVATEKNLNKLFSTTHKEVEAFARLGKDILTIKAKLGMLDVANISKAANLLPGRTNVAEVVSDPAARHRIAGFVDALIGDPELLEDFSFDDDEKKPKKRKKRAKKAVSVVKKSSRKKAAKKGKITPEKDKTKDVDVARDAKEEKNKSDSLSGAKRKTLRKSPFVKRRRPKVVQKG